MHVTPSFPHMHGYPPAGRQQIKYTKDQITKKSSNHTYGVSFIKTVHEKKPTSYFRKNAIKIPGYLNHNAISKPHSEIHKTRAFEAYKM